MDNLKANFDQPERVARYIEQGPPAFAPGHAGILQMTGVLLAERTPRDGQVLVIGAGGGLEIRWLAGWAPGWRFVGVDPAPAMLDLARATAGPIAGGRLSLIEGVASDAPPGPFDSATCILVLGQIADDGAKLSTLSEVRKRLRPNAPFILVDQCFDRTAPDFALRLDRYAAYALSSGVEPDVVASAKRGVEALASMASASRNEQLIVEAGFHDAEVFYVGMAWRGWVSYA